MGICLDTEQQQNGAGSGEDGSAGGGWVPGRGRETPPDGQFPQANDSHVKFEAPRVPVLFVLGGPGSGKVTHGDNLMQEKRGITHINMTDLLQQYAIGNEMRDFGQLSSKTVTEVLMLEMKLAPAAKTYLVSGYPRSMRDVVEYAEKIKVVNGVILVAWQQKILERQIDYGAKLGHVVLSLAKMELANFYKNVMPVAEYFDQRGMLITINGERNPNDVYKDFRSAVLQILGSAEMPNTLLQPAADHAKPITNGVGPHIPPGPPGLPSLPAQTYTHTKTSAQLNNHTRIPSFPVSEPNHFEPYKPPGKGFPPVLWVIGGPGSNKGALCQRVVRQAPGWVHFSIGRLLRSASESPGNDAAVVRQAIASGEMVPQTYMLQLVESQMNTNMSAQGILMDGFPRDMTQVHEFESKFQQQPNAILLDCSKLQLGRGRLDDSVAAFRRRLELFREISLPMLKTLDNENRLTIVDGDTDTPAVQAEFERAVLHYVDMLRRAGGMIVPQPAHQHHQHGRQHRDTQLHDLEDMMPMPAPMPQPRASNGMVPNGNGVVPNGTGMPRSIQNGLIGGISRIRNSDPQPPQPSQPPLRPSRDTILNMYADVETYPMGPHF